MKIVSRRWRTIVAIVAMLAPSRLRRFLHVRLLGYEIDPTARIGRCLIEVDAFRAGPRATVQSLSVLRGCERVEMEADSHIGSLTWINAVHRSSPSLRSELDRDPALVLRRSAAITGLHFVDCCDRVELEEFSVLGGLMSQILTHSFDYRAGQQACAPVQIGAYTVVGTRNLLMPGATIGSRCIVAGGAVLPGGKFPELSLLAGVPASAKETLDPGAKMFNRTAAKIY